MQERVCQNEETAGGIVRAKADSSERLQKDSIKIFPRDLRTTSVADRTPPNTDIPFVVKQTNRPHKDIAARVFEAMNIYVGTSLRHRQMCKRLHFLQN